MRVGIEVGGTFTDLVAVDGNRVEVVKVPSTPFAELVERWRRQARDAGGPAQLELPTQLPRSGRAVLDEHRFAGVISLTAHGGARRRDVVTAFGAALASAFPARRRDDCSIVARESDCLVARIQPSP